MASRPLSADEPPSGDEPTSADEPLPARAAGRVTVVAVEQDVVNGTAAHFVWLGRGKESVTLNLKHPAGLAVLHRLLARADVLVSNLGPARPPGSASTKRHWPPATRG